MIDQTRAPSPQTVTEPSGAAAPSRQPAAVPFQSWVTSGNGEETFVSSPNWRGDKADLKPAPVVATAAIAAQVAAADDRWQDGDAASEPAEDVAAAAPSPASTAAPKPAPKPAAGSEREPVIDYTSGNGEARFVPMVAGDTAANKGNVHAFAEGDEPTVWDLIDFINPLQHIPVVNLIYRELTGDKIGALPQIVGGAMLGGPIGALSAIVNVVVQETTGKDLGGQVMALLGDEPEAAPAPSGIRLADAPTPGTPTPGTPTGQTAAPDDKAAPKPRGHIEVTAPTPSDTFVPYTAAPASVLPTAQAQAAHTQANKTNASKMKMPPRATPTPPVTAASLGRVSADAVKPAAVPLAAKTSAVPPVDAPAPGEAESDGATDQEALATPGPTTSRRAISAGDSAHPQANPGNTADFVAKFMSAMDKYDKASRLTPAQAAAAATAAANAKKPTE